MRYIERLLLLGIFILGSLPVFAQTDINHYTLFTGFDYMISPARNLTERGFESDFGVTVKPWLGMGVDVGIIGGAGTINWRRDCLCPAGECAVRAGRRQPTPRAVQLKHLHLCCGSAVLYS